MQVLSLFKPIHITGSAGTAKHNHRTICETITTNILEDEVEDAMEQTGLIYRHCGYMPPSGCYVRRGWSLL